MSKEITDAEIRRLDFYALETLTKSILALVISEKPEIEKQIATLFENSIYSFQFFDNPGEIKADAARQHMLERGHQWIASASNFARGKNMTDRST
ncbi:hypothetical protein IB024_01890 [Brucella sp. 6810]|uniref:Uncharacterized protein n=1 Tax=Brucella inopinata TaxID=1218315 RepID=A0AAW7B5N0_9HYPH|nr:MULTISPECIES: hypothetical protein [Brucella]KEY04349.1 hypothetical protein IL59_0210595 [Brucella suis bv. 4 str. 40]MDL2333536.1 hypothetical protein [Brucella inopinata]QNQ62534.1 hypothetical protein IB024_01890 [Brucella sp. 6810]